MLVLGNLLFPPALFQPSVLIEVMLLLPVLTEENAEFEEDGPGIMASCGVSSVPGDIEIRACCGVGGNDELMSGAGDVMLEVLD